MDTDALFNKASCFLNLNLKANSLECFEEILKINPNDDEVN